MINKVNYKAFVTPEYKSDSAGDDEATVSADALNTDEVGEDLNETVEDIFNDTSSSESSAVDPFSLGIDSDQPLGYTYDSLTGEMVEDPSSRPYYIKSIDDFLSDSRVAGLNMKVSDYDELKTLYQNSLSDLKAERTTLTEKLESGTLYATDVNYYKKLIVCIDKSIITAKEALSKIDALKDEAILNYDNELTEMKKIIKENYSLIKSMTYAEFSSFIEDKLSVADINADGWIGEPDVALRIVKDVNFEDGTEGTALYNAATQKYQLKFSKSGTPVTQKWFDASNTWTLSNAGLVTATDTDEFKEDLVLDVNNSSKKIEYDNKFNAKIDLSIPDFITVRADDDNEAKTRKDRTDGTYYIPAKFTDDGNGKITQEPVDDDNMDKYIQVRVDKVEVKSVKPQIKDADGKLIDDEDAEGYDQLVKFKDSLGFVIAEVRVRGCQTATNNDRYASNYGFSLNAGHGDKEERTESVVIDATQLISTYQHNIADATNTKIKDEYDIDLASLKTESGKANPTDTYNKTMDLFTTGGKEVEKDSAEATGLMAWGLNGYVEGSKHGNNLVCFGDPSKYQDLDSNDGSDEANPLYANVFVGNGQDCNSNAVFAAERGDLYASDVTLAYRNCTDEEAVTAVTVKSNLGMEKRENSDDPNIRDPYIASKENDGLETEQDFYVKPCDVFVTLLGDGQKFVDNPEESSTEYNSTYKMYVDTTKHGTDYFNTEGEGVYSLPQVNPDGTRPGDWDADSTEGGSDDSGVLGKRDIVKKGQEIETELRDLFDADEEDINESVVSDDLGGDYYEESYSAMKEAFDELAEGLNITQNSDLDEEDEEE